MGQLSQRGDQQLQGEVWSLATRLPSGVRVWKLGRIGTCQLRIPNGEPWGFWWFLTNGFTITVLQPCLALMLKVKDQSSWPGHRKSGSLTAGKKSCVHARLSIARLGLNRKIILQSLVLQTENHTWWIMINIQMNYCEYLQAQIKSYNITVIMVIWKYYQIWYIS